MSIYDNINVPCGCKTVPHTCSTVPQGTTTHTCANVICKSKNWGKCILYGGPDIGCSHMEGGVATFTDEGTGGDTGTFSTTDLVATGGSGTGAVFTVSQAGTTEYTVTVTTAGTGYQVGDVLTIPGPDIQGSYASPANDVTITIVTLSSPVSVLVPIIEFEDDYDSIIQVLNERICALTPEGLDYTAFNFDCLRQGGLLGTGSVITTEKQFVEAASAALCDLDARIDVLEAPNVTADCITGLGPDSSLTQILNAIIAKICEVEDVFALPITVTADCFTSAPAGTDPISDWIQWIVDNTCAIKTSVLASIATQTTRVDNINTYLHGTTAPAYPITYDLSCTYLGGSATANVHTTLQTLITKLCALGATVAAMPASSITLDWATCFSAAPYSYTGAAQTLQVQLERLLNVASREKITTWSSEFTVTDGACGKSVSLDTSTFVFDCDDLMTCSIHKLSDVSDNTSPTNCYQALRWNADTNVYEILPDPIINNIGVQNNQSGTYSGEPLGFYYEEDTSIVCPNTPEFNIGFMEQSWASVINVATGFTVAVTDPVQVKKTWEGDIKFRGTISGDQTVDPFGVAGGVRLFTLPTNYGFTYVSGTPILYMDCNIYYYPQIGAALPPLMVPGRLGVYYNTGANAREVWLESYDGNAEALDCGSVCISDGITMSRILSTDYTDAGARTFGIYLNGKQLFA